MQVVWLINNLALHNAYNRVINAGNLTKTMVDYTMIRK